MKKKSNEYADLNMMVSKFDEWENDILNDKVLMENLRKLADD